MFGLGKKKKKKVIGVIPLMRNVVETDTELTNFMYNESKYLWECVRRLPYYNWSHKNYRKRGNERYHEMNNDITIYPVFWRPCGSNDNWRERVQYADFVLDKKGQIIEIKCTSTNGINYISISKYDDISRDLGSSEKNVLMGQFELESSNYGHNYGKRIDDDNFYFIKKGASTDSYFRNDIFESSELHDLLEEFISYLGHLMYNTPTKEEFYINEEKKKNIECSLKLDDNDLLLF